MSSADRLLERLDSVRQTRTNSWIARCPAHEDKSPSLSVRQKDDGRVLVRCFAGCEAGSVMAAVGLTLADLFDKPLAHHLPPIRGGFSSRELLELNAREVMVAAMLTAKAADGPLTEEEALRLRQAAARLTTSAELTGG